MNESDQRLALAAALLGRYRIEDTLGQGGMATVYRAVDLRTGATVALKALRPELSAALGPERFAREIQLAASLSHPGILAVYDSGSAPSALWYTMPLVEGESLRQRLEREKDLPVPEALRIARRLAEALAHAHGRGIIHRDIKPENILLQGDLALLADFGIALDLTATGKLTSTGMVLGTAAYMSPEQAAGDRSFDGRSDLYSLGCVLYEMLAGQSPFVRPSAQALMVAHATLAPEPLRRIRPSVPPAVEEVVRRCLEKRPADRYSSAAELAATLRYLEDSLVSGAPLPAVPASQWEATKSLPTTPRPHFPRGTVAIGSLVLLILGVTALKYADLLPRDTLLRSGALASRDILLVGEFKSPAGDSTIGLAVGQALKIDLGNSQIIDLMQDSDVRERLRQMQRSRSATIDDSTAHEIAVRSGLKMYVTGEVDQVGSSYLISARIVSTATGQDLGAFRETATSADEVIPAVERLSKAIRGRVGESLRVLRDETPLPEAMTSSLPALRAFASGYRMAAFEGDWKRGVPLTLQAVALDSNFALAQLELGIRMGFFDRWAADSHLARAYALRDHLGTAERLLTEFHYANRITRDNAAATAIMRQLAALFPKRHFPFTYLGRGAELEGHDSLAEVLYSKAFANDSNRPLVSGGLLAVQYRLGHQAAAEATAKAIVARGPGGAANYFDWRVGTAWDASAYDSAEAILNSVPDSLRETQNWAMSMVALLRARGRPQGAARLVREAAAGDPSPPGSPALRSTLYREALAGASWALSNGASRDSVSRALDHLLATVPLDSLPPDARPYLPVAEVYARAGNIVHAHDLLREREAVGRAQGARTAANYAAEVNADSGSSVANLSWGAIALAEGQFDTAVVHLRAAGRGPPHIRGLPELAEAYERKGMPDSSIAIYRRYLATKDLGRLLIDANARAVVVQRLAELSEQRGDKAGAIDAYQEYLSLWRGAEPAQQLQLQKSKARLARLSGGPR